MGYSFDDYLKTKEAEKTDSADKNESGEKSGWLSFDEYMAQANQKSAAEEKTSAAHINVPQIQTQAPKQPQTQTQTQTQTLKQRQQINRDSRLFGGIGNTSTKNTATGYKVPNALKEYQKNKYAAARENGPADQSNSADNSYPKYTPMPGYVTGAPTALIAAPKTDTYGNIITANEGNGDDYAQYDTISVVEHAEQIWKTQGSTMETALAQIEEAKKNAELARGKLEDLLKDSAVTLDANANPHFSNEQSAAAYNYLVQQMKHYSQQEQNAIDAYNYAVRTINYTAQTVDDFYNAVHRSSEDIERVISAAKNGEIKLEPDQMPKLLVEKKAAENKEASRLMQNAQEYVKEDGTADIASLENDIAIAQERLEEINDRIDEIEDQLTENDAKLSRDERIALQSEEENLLKEKADVEEKHDTTLKVYFFVWAYQFRQMEEDSEYEKKVKQGKERYTAEYEAYEDEMSGNRAYLTTLALTPEENLGSAVAPFREEARQNHPIVVDITALTREEQNNFYYLLATGQDYLAVEYVQQIARRNRRETLNEISEWAGTNTFTRLLSSIGSVLSLPYSGYDMQLYKNNMAASGASGGIGFGAVADALRGGAAQGLTEKGLFNTGALSGTISEDFPIVGGKGIGDAYQLGMSMIDSLTAGMIFGKSAAVMLGSKAASSAFNNAIEKGATYDQAVMQGVAQGIAEAMFEYVSLDQLLSGNVNSGMVKRILKQGGVEASEEVLTSIANSITDRAIMKDMSDFETMKRTYMKEGLSEKEAESKAYQKTWDSIVFDAFGGFLSGGGMSVMYNGAYKRQAAYNNWAGQWADVAMQSDKESAAYKEGEKLRKMVDRGEYITEEYMQGISKRLGEDTYSAIDRSAHAGKSDTATDNAPLIQTEQRAELVQENNPDAEVVKSRGTQLYLDKNAPLEVAEKAGEVLDGILSGEITSENITGKKADKLRLFEPYSAEIVSEALGVDIPKVTTAAQARAAVKTAVRAYEQRIKAVATQENNAHNGVQQSVDTSSVRNELASQAQKTASAAAPDVQEQTSAPRPAAETADQEALQMQSERNSTRGDFYAQLPTEEGASAAPAGAMSYEDFKYRMRTDREFRNRYTDEGAKGLSQEARNLRAYDLYQDRMGQMQTAAGTLSRTRFAEAYREINATKKNPAQDTEVDLAYQDYLEMQQDRTVTESEQDTVPADYIGLVENEISAAVPQEVREAVDALAKQFGLQISYEDIGSDNGYYIPETNRVVLDINPVRSAVDDAGRSAYLFTVAHEVGHYARENMSEEAWESFEANAVAAMGGETAVSAKMQEADDDGNSIYNTEDLAREDVACDFLGKILSDKDALTQFCDAIRDKTVSQPAARGILGAIRKVLAKLAGNKAAKRSEASVQQSVAEGLELFAEDIEAGRKAASEIADALAELAKQPRPLMNSKQAEAILAEAKNKNAADTGDVKPSKKNNTKRSATSPLSGSPATQGSISMASKPVTAAADHLGIDISLSQLSDSVKGALSAFSEIVDAIDNGSPVFDGKKKIGTSNLIGALIKSGVLSRRGVGLSAYRTDGNHTLRISDHSARADNFATSGENLSVVLLKTNKTNDFSGNETNNVVEVHFKKDYLDRNPEAFKNLVKDMARFVATGEYHDTAGAKNYNISGTEQFRTEMAQSLAEDERARSAAAKDTVKRSHKDVPATNMDSTGKQLSEGQQEYFHNSVVRDEDGNLLVVYHGTDAEFTVFDILKAGKNGRAEGYGFYFSDDQEITRKYGGRQMAVYLNITKPLYSDRKTLTRAELRKFTDAVISNETQTYDMDWRDSFISNYIDTYSGRISRAEAVTRFVNQIWEANENDQDLIYEIANGSGQNYSVESMKRFYATLKDSIGVDGNISTWHHADGTSNVYVAFSPEQAKNIDNANPTRNPDIRRSRKDSTEFTQNDVKVYVSDTKDGYSLDVDGEKFEFVWKQGIDGTGKSLYNKSGKRSAALQDVVKRLHSEEAVSVEEVMSLPEVELSNKLSEADDTINLPNRDAIHNAGYEKAMSLGSFNSKTGRLDGKVLRERRMDVVIGLPGSGKSSVYSNRLSEEHGERIIDTDDFREYIPEYNGMNASVVHQEASLMRDMVLDEATQRGENILLSTVGASAKSLANKIRDYTSDGYSVYLHLNELPYLESVARVLERYVSKDGRLGRVVSPDIVFGCKNAPTQTYLEITGQEEYYGTLELGEEIPGSRGMGGSARARDIRAKTERTGEEGERGRSSGREKGENDVSDLLAGFDWYNNNVKYGEEPIVVQANRDAAIQRRSEVRRSRKDRQNETARVPRLPTRQEAEAILRRSREEQKAREIAEESRREASRRSFVENAPARRKSAKNTQLEDLVAKHGAIQPGENPARDVAVPNRTTADTKVRRTVRTALEAEVTADSLVPVIEDSIVARNFDYKPKKNQRTVEEAHKWLETHKSAKAAYKAWLSDKSRHLNADMIARGFVLYNTFATAANQTENATERRELQENAVDILHDISVMGTVAGQTAQAIRLLKQQTPDAQYYALERAVAKLQSDINEQFGEKKAGAPQIVIDKELAGKWIQALRQGKTEQANDLETLLYQSIAAQVPKTVYDRINAWRYLAMLGNPKTLIRNAVGNLAFTPMAALKDQIGAALERIFLPKEQRTKYAGFRSFTKEGRELLKYADLDIESAEVQQMLSTRKYDDTNVNDRLGRAIAEKKSTFTLPGLKHWQAATRYMMEKMPFAGDDFYKGIHYKRVFASAAMARGYTAEDFRSGRVSENERWEIRAYAAKQAMKATFNDANMVSNFVRGWRVKNKAANILVEGVVPFKGTPANVLVRAVEYGPVGLLKALTADVYSVKTGRITGQEYIDRISSGLTGTAIAGLGYLLAALGVIRVNADDDDEREGKQTYSLEMFGKSITLDWLSPSSIPLFMGAEINELMNGEGYESFADALIDTYFDFFAPILEMSMLSGAKDLLDNFVYAYSDGANVGEIISSLFVQPFFSYLGQFLPTIMSQTANAFEPNRTTTYVGDISGKRARSFVRNIAKLTEKIPFVDWRQIDYVDDWGNVESNGGLLARFFNSFINPAYVNDIVVTDVDAEIARIKEENGADIAPERRDEEIVVSVYDDDETKISSEKVKLNGDQYSKYQREYGQQYALMAAALMASDYYDELSDSDKVKAFQEIESLADEYGKLAAGVGYVIAPGSSDNKLYTLTESGMPVAEAYAARLMYTQLNGDEGIKPVDKYERFRTWVFENDDWTGEEKTAVIDLFGKFSSGYVVSSETYDRLVSSNVIDASTASSITEGIRAIVPPAGSDEVSVYQKYDYILGRDDLTNEQKDAAIAAYMSETEKERFDVCAKSGVSATAYVTVMSTIHSLKPLEGRSAVTDGQKWEVCVNAVSSEKQQDALLDRYMDSNQAAKYDMARSAGVSPKLYVKYYNAKYTYGDKNGSWKQSELQSWLDANVSSTSQKAVLWEIANSGWKNNPYR